MKTLSDFYNMDIAIGVDGKARIIYDHTEDQRPVTLIGFETDASKSDNEIREDAFQYYKNLLEKLNKK